MNDGGLDKPIREAADNVNSQLRSRKASSGTQSQLRRQGIHAAFQLDLARDNSSDRSNGPPQRKRWWYMSTAFPMIAGTFGPIANLMSICSLVQTWRVYIDGTRISDPHWAIVLNALSLTSAVIANLLLLFNFARRIRYSLAQPLTIGLWYLATILLVVPIGIIDTIRVDSTTPHQYSQSYYYGIISASVYFAISTLLVANLIGSYHFKAFPPSFQTLSIPQRTLMLQTIAYSFYLAIGALIFSTIEDWAFVDAIYWADYTLLTIGLGSDFQLTKNLSRGLLIPYAVGGITALGLIVGSVRSMVLERAKVRIIKTSLIKQRERWIQAGKHNQGGDQEWRKHEFDAMRHMEERADKMRKYVSLANAFLVFCIVWFVGSAVFMFCETSAGWTYWNALYFSYIALLTVGYGDFYPASNAGKAFFVIWSLIAVPTMTVLISNMGETIVFWIKRGTISLARRTILPEKDLDLHDERLLKSNVDIQVQPGDSLTVRLMKEIRTVAKDVAKTPPPKYHWDQWIVWLELLTEKAVHDAMEAGKGESDVEAAEEIAEEVSEVVLSWLADNGPLFSDADEPEWILTQLCRRLEVVLEEEARK
ncbi:hypothetical protein DL96DRAFT_1587388 [Flagelloscypha sp. PMI_526]|nr:hypothetical protein DL96DRAFT_1587388 [Flagelloscypha sp. PMI_526]